MGDKHEAAYHGSYEDRYEKAEEKPVKTPFVEWSRRATAYLALGGAVVVAGATGGALVLVVMAALQ